MNGDRPLGLFERVFRFFVPEPVSPGAASAPAPHVSVAGVSMLDGGEIALEVLQAISYRVTLKKATIVSFISRD